MALTEKEKDKISELVLDRIIAICKLHKVNYFGLSSNQQDVMISIFQAGVEFIESLKEEL